MCFRGSKSSLREFRRPRTSFRARRSSTRFRTALLVLDAALRVTRANPRYFEHARRRPRPRRSDASCSRCRTGSGAPPPIRTLVRAIDRGRRSDERRSRARARRRRRALAARPRPPAAPLARTTGAEPAVRRREPRDAPRARRGERDDRIAWSSARWRRATTSCRARRTSCAVRSARSRTGCTCCPRARRTVRSCSRASRRSSAR